ncbi:acylneuraminate cytidylyltransferase family protein [Jejuia pallidilutea]|uniref:N-acetylneuraminate cytidylyltransferase n=1 Tax=Jejuia pallidilutea TaxID=504487 RepID=A0A090VXA3_9FLAO|nr:acylneuraminate cytidylyltransferase family protein [Jejuia pallidilutea]GAL69370.1 N-acetylneuraminate cytidylyltransferase [Jejuia pallidilutea]GAL89109.1 N-Acetylneuraminate cytidylyltransferase [Jejuia pallidilutea]
MKKVIALLPMKGVSERVPNKNIKDFNGSPLYHVTLKNLLKSKYIDNVVINTDSEELKTDIRKHFGANVQIRDRKQEICGNYISMNKILEDDIHSVESDIYLQTHSTNPLLKTETIDRAIEKMISVLERGENDSVFSVTKVQKRFYNADGTPMNHDPKMLTTQHLKPIYEENSCFYLFTKESFKSNNGRIGVNPFMFEIDKIESTDIDEPEDFKIAQVLYNITVN